MFVLACNISIGAVTYRQVHEVRIENDFSQLTDEAFIELPRISNVLADNLKAGDAVKIQLAYEGVYEGIEFTGYVRQVSPKIPVVVECENAAYLMKRVNIIKAWKETTLKEVLTYLVDETNKAGEGDIITLNRDLVPDIDFETFRISNVNAARAVQDIKDRYGLKAYFRDHQLYVGLAYIDRPGEVGYNLGKNVIEDKLTFRTADQVRLRVKATSILKDNKHIDVEVGDPDGELRSLTFYNITDKATLQTLAKEEIQKYRYDGFEGSLKTFLIPYATHGMTAKIFSPNYPQKDGSYHIDKVTTSFGVNGARRDVTIGIKLV